MQFFLIMNKIILDLCGGTGAWSKPYKDAGYDVRIITLPEYDIERYIPPEDVHGILAAPPCTMFSRARTTGGERDFEKAMSVVKACLRIIWDVQYRSHFQLKFWALENPRGHLQRFLGRPVFKFQPWHFGDRYSKETWLWGFFNNPKPKNITPLTQTDIFKSRNNTRKLPEIPEDYIRDPDMKTIQIQRSITPSGFAEAFFKANP